MLQARGGGGMILKRGQSCSFYDQTLVKELSKQLLKKTVFD